mgnify:CR=1 FL=1
MDAAARALLIDTIERTPATYGSLTKGKTDAELDTPHWPQGWTVRQVVHHVPDSHMNAYQDEVGRDRGCAGDQGLQRSEVGGAARGESRSPEMSLALLDALHRRWVMFLRALTDADFAKVYVHPEMGSVRLDEALALYAWHCRHHEGHIKLGLGARG